jgi:hypothetical protein
MRMRGGQALALLLLGMLFLANPALAQEATPAAGGVAKPRVVEPKQCHVQPRPVDEIAQLLQLDGAGLTAPAMMTFTQPLGTPVDPATKIAIHEAVGKLIACFNAQDLPRAAALMTDTGLQRAFWGLSSSAAAREATKARLAAKPTPRQEPALIRLIAVTDVSRLPDGRVAAFAIVNDPLLPPPGPEAVLMVFTQQGDAWLLDDLVRFLIIPPRGAATPAPAG